jgi:hypothetical protein
MPPRERLLGWLEDAATRAGRQRRLHDGTWGAACLLVLAACHATVVRFAGAPVVVTALGWLLLLGALAIVAGVVARGWRRPRLAAVAAAVDAKAGLRDELVSAHWFATHAGQDPFVELHLRRAAQTAGGLTIGSFFPPRVPRAAAAVAVAASIVGTGAWSLPPGVAPMTPVPETAPGGAAHVARDDPPAARARVAPEAAMQEAAGLWKQLEMLAGEWSRRPEGQSLAQAIVARDARAAAQAVRDMRKDAPTRAVVAAAPEAPNEQMSDALAQGILERLAELLKTGEAVGAARQSGATEGERPTARLERELRDEQEDAERGAPRQASAGEDALNTSLRALSRTGTGGRDAVHGEADSAQGAGRASVGGGAMGRRVGVSGTGAGEGDQPVAGSAAAPDGEPVLGRRTERLAVQLRAVRVPQGESDAQGGQDDAAGTEESAHDATRAQAARVAFESVGTASRDASERALDAERSPLEFRDAVKRYTLARHRREPDPRRARDGAP